MRVFGFIRRVFFDSRLVKYQMQMIGLIGEVNALKRAVHRHRGATSYWKRVATRLRLELEKMQAPDL